jgi:hypothetical protein
VPPTRAPQIAPAAPQRSWPAPRSALDDARGEVAIRGVPPVAVDAERLDVDTGTIHLLDPRRADDLIGPAAAVLLECRALGGLLHRHNAMGVNVNHPHTPTRDRDLAATADRRGRWLREEPGGSPRFTPQDHATSRRSQNNLDEIPAVAHSLSFAAGQAPGARILVRAAPAAKPAGPNHDASAQSLQRRHSRPKMSTALAGILQ